MYIYYMLCIHDINYIIVDINYNINNYCNYTINV